MRENVDVRIDFLGLHAFVAIAERGSGAFLDGARLRVAPAADAAGMTGFANPQFFPKAYRDHLRAAGQKIAKWESLHCAAHEYLRVAEGSAQFALYSRLKPWDHAAGTLLVEEAGGVARLWSGENYRPAAVNVGLIAAASEDNWRQCHDLYIKNAIAE